MSFRASINGTTFADRVLLLVLLLVSLGAAVFIREALPRLQEVTIEVDGAMQYRYPLDVDRTVTAEGHNGRLTVEIKDRQVRVLDATCPNKRCVRQGRISTGAILCLPGRISVTVGDPEKAPGRTVDAITG